MKRIVTMILALTLLVSLLVFPASAAQTLDILDPGRILGVKGNCYNATGKNIYDMYVYDFYGTPENVEDFLQAYEKEMDKTAFTRTIMESETAEYSAYYFYKDQLVMIMRVSLEEDLSREYGKGMAEWFAMLLVVDGYNVTRYLK